MSGNAHIHRSRGFALVGSLVAASLALPSISHAQSVAPEYALLYQVTVTAGIPPALHMFRSAPADPSAGSGVTGEQALLGRTAPLARSDRSEWSAVAVPPRRLVIDGEAALMGKRD